MSKMRRLFKGGENGFTLIELLVVIAVLGILAAIAIPRLGGVTDKARLTEAVSLASNIRNAQEMFYVENGNKYYPTTGGAVKVSANEAFPKNKGIGDYIDSLVPSGWKVVFNSADDTTYAVSISGVSSETTGLGVNVTSRGVQTYNNN